MTAAHELLGHALKAVIGELMFHGKDRDKENQINKTVNNAKENFKLHNE